MKKLYLLLALSLSTFVFIFTIIQKKAIRPQISNKSFIQEVESNVERILRLDQTMFLQGEEYLAVSATGISNSLCDNEVASNNFQSYKSISELYEEYVNHLPNSVSEGTIKNEGLGSSYTLGFGFETQKTNENNLDLGNNLYLSDHLKYLHGNNWVFELEVNDVLFWMEPKEDGKYFSLNSREKEESAVVTFSIKYSF